MTEWISCDFIIPAFNEESSIGITIESIFSSVPEDIRYSVIVVDNGSSDRTPALAQEYGAKVIVAPVATIGELRNIGAAESSADFLVFLDADISLSAQWQNHIYAALLKIKNQKCIIGSHVTPPEDAVSIFEKYWFNSIAQETGSVHIGSAHMIISRAWFNELGGFDKTLTTGEDYDICRRALLRGGTIANIQELKVFHRGFPTTVSTFIRREAWHGIGDWQPATNALRSKVVVASLLFLLFHAVAVAALFFKPEVSVIASLSIVALLLVSSVVKFSHAGAVTILVNSGILYLYYIGRLLSIPLAMSAPEK